MSPITWTIVDVAILADSIIPVQLISVSFKVLLPFLTVITSEDISGELFWEEILVKLNEVEFTNKYEACWDGAFNKMTRSYIRKIPWSFVSMKFQTVKLPFVVHVSSIICPTQTSATLEGVNSTETWEPTSIHNVLALNFMSDWLPLLLNSPIECVVMKHRRNMQITACDRDFISSTLCRVDDR